MGSQWPAAESDVEEYRKAVCTLEIPRIQLKLKGLELIVESISGSQRACTARLKGMSWKPGDRCPRLNLLLLSPFYSLHTTLY